MRIFHYIICALLIPSFAVANSCPQGMDFSKELQRCLTSVETSNVASAANTCKNMSSADAQRQCFEDAARGTVAKAENEGKIEKAQNLKRGANVSYILNMLVGIYVIQYFLLKGEDCPAAWSVMLMGGGAITAFGGEIVSSIMYGKKLKKTEADFQNLIQSQETLDQKASLDIQGKSFLLLEEQEQNFREAAKWKEGFYWASTAFYTGAAVAAGIEIATMGTTMGTAGSTMYCPVNETGGAIQKSSQTTLEEIFPSLNVDLPSEVAWNAPVPEPDIEVAKTWSRYQDWLAFGDNNNHETKTCTSVDQYESYKQLWADTSKEDSINFAQILLTGAHTLKNQLSIPDAEAWFPCKTHPSGRCDTLIATKQDGIMYNKDKDQCEVKGKKVDCPPEALQKMRCRVNGLVSQGARILRTASGQALHQASSLGGQQMGAFDQCNCTPAPATCAPTELPEVTVRNTQRVRLSAETIRPTLSVTTIMPIMAPLVLPPMPNLLPVAHPKPAVPDQGKWWQKALASPWTRLAMSGAMGVMSGLAVKNVKEQIDASENREAYIRKVRENLEGYEEAFVCSSEDRNNPGKPKCYCYTDKGQRNSSRSNSQVCVAQQKKGNPSITTLGGCMSAGGVYQSNCACKSGEGKGCFRPLPGKVPIAFQAATATFGDLNSGVSRAFANDPTFGSAQLSQMGQGATLAAARTLEKLKANPKIAKQLPMVAKYEKELGEIQNRTLAYANSTGLSDIISKGAFTSGFAPTPADKQDGSLDKARDAVMRDNPNLFGSPTSVESSDEPGFEIATESLEEKTVEISEEAKVEQVLKENFDYGENDINGSGGNIFEILSNRYQRSGMQKLFEEK